MAFYDGIIEKERKMLGLEAKPVPAPPKPVTITETAEELKKKWETEYKPMVEEIKKLAEKYRPKIEEFGRKVWKTLEKIKEERERKKLEAIFKEAGIPVVEPEKVSEELGIPVM